MAVGDFLQVLAVDSAAGVAVIDTAGATCPAAVLPGADRAAAAAVPKATIGPGGRFE
jgi:hypothetical protein